MEALVTDWSFYAAHVWDQINDTWNVTTILGILAGLIGVGVVFTLLWWGVRKTARAVMSAVKRGRISV